MADWKVPAAAKELGVSQSFLYQLLASGQVEYQRYGPNAVRLTDAQLVAIRERYAQKTQPVRRPRPADTVNPRSESRRTAPIRPVVWSFPDEDAA